MFSTTLNKIMRLLFWSVFIWLFIRIFIFQIFSVPTASMNNTLKEGDYILVNKLAYGTRIPITSLSLPFGNTYLDWLQIPYLRFPGYADVKHNDILVFNFPLEESVPVDHRKEYVKRCIGLPGDTIQIKNGIVSVNNKTITETEKIIPVTHPSDSLAYSPVFFPNSSFIKWNADHFGPLYVPKKGEQILLTKENAILYKRLISVYEKNKIQILNDVVFINDVQSLNYTFKMNYYFVLGDNRPNSNDSRFWGFVPEDHLIGRVSQ